ncbi:hypothetical protein BJ165DRAFT_335705 [Panaeolus papilionaceus]|nr:hypothetical protein BJ165DRAFT_335705 [Panaeolus papilionaceus]
MHLDNDIVGTPLLITILNAHSSSLFLCCIDWNPNSLSDSASEESDSDSDSGSGSESGSDESKESTSEQGGEVEVRARGEIQGGFEYVFWSLLPLFSLRFLLFLLNLSSISVLFLPLPSVDPIHKLNEIEQPPLTLSLLSLVLVISSPDLAHSSLALRFRISHLFSFILLYFLSLVLPFSSSPFLYLVPAFVVCPS